MDVWVISSLVLAWWRSEVRKIHTVIWQSIQVARLSQRNRAAGWVSFGWVVGDGVGHTILCTKHRCKKTKSIDLLRDKSTFIWQTVTLHFWAPLYGGLGPTYAVYLRLIGKPVVYFLLVIIELFSLGAMVQALRVNITWKSPFLKGVGHFGPKVWVEGDVPHQPSVHG